MARRKKRGSKASKRPSAAKARVRTMKSRKPKTRVRRTTRGKYLGGK